MNRRPVLITPPSRALVTLAEVKAQCRIDHAHEDAVLNLLIAAAVGYLDGWSGILGRCLRPQVWRQEFEGWGDLMLAMPDVSAVTVTGFDAEGDALAATKAEIMSDAAGVCVETEGPAAAVKVRVDYTCAMQPPLIDQARQACLMLVAHWYVNREAAGASMQSSPLAFEALIAPLRWRYV